MQYDIVGSHLQNYDFMINLAHFKGHAMGGFGGVLKNQSIGVASSAGKLYIHSAGKSQTHWTIANQDAFLESMAAATQAVHDYFKQDGKDIVYINVMNNMSVDCDCDGHPAAPRIKDIGILASTDPVALDQACLDLVFNHVSSKDNDAKPLQDRINKKHGTHTVEYAEQIGLGTRKYTIVNIDLDRCTYRSLLYGYCRQCVVLFHDNRNILACRNHVCCTDTQYNDGNG